MQYKLHLPIASTQDPLCSKPKEQCGVIAVWLPIGSAPDLAARLVHHGLFALQHRGQQAAGIASLDDHGRIHSARARGLVSNALPVERVAELPGHVAVGHVRYSTVAQDHEDNLQPLHATTPYGRLAIAHNGNIKNADELSRILLRSGAMLYTTMDTEVLLQLVARSGATDFPGALTHAAAQLVGSYSLTMMRQGRIYGLRDGFGVRPLVLGKIAGKNLGWIIASETCALHSVGAEYVREVEPGELVEIGPMGIHSTQLLPPRHPPAPCVFELVYFSRPESKVFGQSVYAARFKMGIELARQDIDLPKPDLVIPVPDSGVPAALGYSRESQLPFERAVLRGNNVDRTFILPSQDERTQSLSRKLSVSQSAVQGKRVVLVDDSLVRGNTARVLVKLVRDRGAKEVWLRLASPPIGWPCHLGVDIRTRDELLINRASEERNLDGSVLSPAEIVRRYVGADSLRYLSLSKLRRATLEQPFCMACMTGEYPL